MIEKSLKILNKKGFLVYIVCSFHPFETIEVIDKIMQKHKNIKLHKINSDKMIKRQSGYFINPLSFKELGGSDIFFVVCRKNKMKTIISPSILGGSFSNMEKTISELDISNAEYIHFDVMDGDFVPNLTFGPQFISDLRLKTKKIFDVHLMINRVSKFLDDYIKAGSDIITFHYEIDENLNEIIDKIKQEKIKAGIAIKPKTSWEEIKKYLHLC